MRLAVSGQPTEDTLALGRQIGASEFVGGPGLPVDLGYYRYQDLLLLRNRVQDAGLRYDVTGMPEEWTYKIKLGLPGRDQQIDSWRRSIENLGAAGFKAIVYFFSLRSSIGHYGLRTSRATPGRGGARVTTFDYDLIKNANEDFWEAPLERGTQVTDQQAWDNLTYFLEAVIPTAEAAGVKLALHPDDPPISPIAGMARVLRSHAALKRLLEIVPSDSNCLTFCVGTISAMPEDVFEALRHFGGRKKICLVHFRNVAGAVPAFRETFIDNGDVDMLKAMRLFKEAGYDGPFVYDHVPEVVGDSENQEQAAAFALGYIKGLMKAVGVDGEMPAAAR